MPSRSAERSRLAIGIACLLIVTITVLAQPARGGEPEPVETDPLPSGDDSVPLGGTCAPLDVALVLDTSTSMDPAIDRVKDQLVSFLDVVEGASGGDYRIGLIDFGRNVTVHVAFADANRDEVAAAIPDLRQTSNNINDPEAWDEALQTAVQSHSSGPLEEESAGRHEGDFSVGWRPEANKLVILVSDARAAGWDDDFDAEDLDAAQATARRARELDISISTIFVPNRNAEDDAVVQLQSVADLSGGAYSATEPNGDNLTSGLDLAVRTCGADTDGDGLYDSWETEGIDHDGDGTVDVDLPAMGADPERRDLFVQVSWMGPPTTGTCHLIVFCGDPPAGFDRPSGLALQTMGDAFAAAPLDNPDGSTGIALHVDAGPATPDQYGIPAEHRRGGELPDSEWADPLFEAELPDDVETSVWDEAMMPVDSLHDRWVPENRRAAFSWVLYVPMIEVDSPSLLGLARGIPSDVVIVNGREMTSTNVEAITVMHELGHTLGLGHGGIDGRNRKPNYLSIMNYEHAFRGGLVKKGQANQLEFSRWSLADLDEAELDETVGIVATEGAAPTGVEAVQYCDPLDRDGDSDADSRTVMADGPVDWNCDEQMDESVSAHLVWKPSSSYEVLTTWNDWGNLSFTGGRRGGLRSAVEDTPEEDDFDGDTYRETPKPHAISMEGGGTLAAAPGASPLIAPVRLNNLGTEDDSYVVEVAATGLDDAEGLADQIELASGDDVLTGVRFDVPEDAVPADVGPDERFVTITATSKADGTVSASATFIIEIDPDLGAPEPTGALKVEPESVEPGATVAASGGGMAESTAVAVWPDERPDEAILVESTALGTFEAALTVPDHAEPGTQALIAAGLNEDGDGVALSGSVEVDPVPTSPSTSPTTDAPVDNDGGGFPLVLLLICSALPAATGLGIGLDRRTRRRNAATPGANQQRP